MVRSTTISERAKQGLRDLRVLGRRLRGEKMPWLVREGPRASGSASANTHSANAAPGSGPSPLDARPAKVVKLVRETEDATSIYLEGEGLDFRAGQFLTLEVSIEGRTHRRAYSIAAAEGDAPFVTVKRVHGGRVSPHLVDELEVGATLKILGPSGSFGFDADLLARPDHSVHAVLVAGGSGITPIISILESLLRTGGSALLLYGSRSEKDIIFEERLRLLGEAYPSSLHVEHVLEEGPGGGKLDGTRAAALLDRHAPLPDAHYFLCGPGPMMDSVRAVLHARALTGLREERFVATPPDSDNKVRTLPQSVTIRLGGAETVVRTTDTLLEAGLDAGLPMPFSCTVGGCAACKVRLVAGSAQMDEPNCLTDEERAEGFVLACCTRPTSPCTVEVPE